MITISLDRVMQMTQEELKAALSLAAVNVLELRKKIMKKIHDNKRVIYSADEIFEQQSSYDPEVIKALKKAITETSEENIRLDKFLDAVGGPIEYTPYFGHGKSAIKNIVRMIRPEKQLVQQADS